MSWLSDIWDDATDAVAEVTADGVNLFLSDEHEITGADVIDAANSGLDTTIQFYEDGVDNVILLGEGIITGDLNKINQFHTNLRDGVISTADGVVDGVFSLGAYAVGGVIHGVNEVPTILGYESISQNVAGTDISPVTTISGADDYILDGIYDAAGYTMRTDGSFGVLHFGGEFVGSGLAAGKVLTWGGRAVNWGGRSLGLTGRTATAGADDAAGIIDDVFDEAAKAMGGTPGVARAAAAGADDAAGTATKAFSTIAARTPRGVYHSNANAADKILELAARANAPGVTARTTSKINKYTNRLINDIAAGRTPIKATELASLRTAGTLTDDVLTRVTEAAGQGRKLLGHTRSKIMNMGDTIRAGLPVVPTSPAGFARAGLLTATFPLRAVANPFNLKRTLGVTTTLAGVGTVKMANDMYFGSELLDLSIKGLGDVVSMPLEGAAYLANGAGTLSDNMGLPEVVGDGAQVLGGYFDTAAAVIDRDRTMGEALTEAGLPESGAATDTVTGYASSAVRTVTGGAATLAATGGSTVVDAAADVAEDPAKTLEGVLSWFANSQLGRTLGDQDPMVQMLIMGAGLFLGGSFLKNILGGLGIPGMDGMIGGLGVLAAVFFLARPLTNAFNNARDGDPDRDRYRPSTGSTYAADGRGLERDATLAVAPVPG